MELWAYILIDLGFLFSILYDCERWQKKHQKLILTNSQKNEHHRKDRGQFFTTRLLDIFWSRNSER